MKIVFCWPGINGYMAACWRALLADGRADVRVLAFHPKHLADSAFGIEVMHGIPHRLIDPNNKNATEICAREILDYTPDIVYLPTWGYPIFNGLAYRRDLRQQRFIMGMDNPWRATMRQRLGRIKVWRYLRRMEKVLVPGERSFLFARRLGIPEKRIVRCALYGIDYANLAPLYDERRYRSEGWPKVFLFMGRYVRDKAIDVLVCAYEEYRRRYGAAAWPLTCCGQGPLEGLLETPGVRNLGFVQPGDLGKVWINSGVLVHPARLDHWPLVIIEALAAGLPVIASEACGSVVETMRPFYNGLTVPTNDTDALIAALSWVHDNASILPQMGERAQHMAAPFAANAWADRLYNALVC
jgi:glycosyltransferase involved in cell wall biosynthesis